MRACVRQSLLPIRKEEAEAASQRALNDPSFFSTAALLRPARAFFVFVGREPGHQPKRLLAGSGPEIRASGRPLAVLVD